MRDIGVRFKFSSEKYSISLQLWYFVYFFLLLWAYVNYIPSNFGYEGYVEQLDWTRVVISIPLVYGLVLVISRGMSASAVFLHFGMMLIIIPSFVLYCGGGKDDHYLWVSVGAYFVTIIAASLFKIRVLKVNGLSATAGLQAGFIVTYIVIALMASFGGFRYFNLDFTLVYDFRQDAEDNLPGAFSYLIPIVTKVVIPIGALLAFKERAWSYFSLLILGSVIIFGLTSHKGILFYPWVALLIFYAAGLGATIKITLLGLIGLTLISGLILAFSDGGMEMFLASLLLRRSILVPAQLNSFYIDWFSASPHVLWAESKISLGLLVSPYDLGMANLIGEKYLHSAEASANTGWIGSGYANGGILGVVLYSIGIGLLFSLLRTYGRKLGDAFVIAAFLPLVLTILMSSDLVATLLTHGLLVAILILVSLSRFEVSESRINQPTKNI